MMFTCASQNLPELLLVTGKQNCAVCTSGPAMMCTTHSIWNIMFHQTRLGVSKPNQIIGNYMDQVRRTVPSSIFLFFSRSVGKR